MSRRSTCYGQQCHFDRTVDHSARLHAIESVQGALLHKIEGYGRRRKTPVSRAEIGQGLAATPAWAIDICLSGLIEAGRVHRVKNGYRLSQYAVELWRTDGSLVDRVFYDAKEQVSEMVRSVSVQAEPGERIAVCRLLGGRRVLFDFTT